MNQIYVPAEGPSNAKLAIVGEAPGGEEERQGRPFVGSTGKIVDDILEGLRSPRETVYLTNVVKIRPPGNNIDALKTIGKSIDDFIPQLRNEIEALKPNCILALGNTALTALTGYHGIEKYRGSIIPCTLAAGKIVPSLHPASLLHAEADSKIRSWHDLTFIKWDFARAIEQSKFEDYNPPRRNLIIARDALQLDRFLRKWEGNQYVSVDIETFKTIPLCIGLAFSSDEAISVPLFMSGMTRSDQISCWEMCARLLADVEVFKIGQNFKFDQRLLKWCINDTINLGFKVNSYFFDTMLAFRTLYPELPSSLQFSTSVLTEEPYYKDEGKEYNPKKDKLDRLLLYNAKDAAVTYEVFEKEMCELESFGIRDFFFKKVMPLHEFYSRIELRGIKRDEFQQKFLKEKYKDRQKELEEELFSLTREYYDEPINVNSNGKNGDVPKLLYGLMRIPARKSTDEKTLEALMRNAVKAPEKRRVLELILETRKVKKTIGTYIDHKTDYRGRTLTSVRIALETGRTSNGILKAPIATEQRGLAFQTITKHGDVGTDLRSMFIPDKGYVLLEPDLSGAEARVVAILGRDDRLLKMFNFKVDLHRVTRSWIDGIEVDNLEEFYVEQDEENCWKLANSINKVLKGQIDNEARQLGKKGRHAANYDMGKREASALFECSEWRARQILDKIHSNDTNIRDVFHREIQEALRDNNRTLISPHGRRRQFFNRWGDELFKEAYADIPQATVSDHNKFAAQRCEKRANWIQILSESHDSFLAQVPINQVDNACKIMTEELETPIDFSKCSLPRGELIIPCEIFIGEKNWEDMRQIK
jgi:uracil-DNA glycosylase family 4